MPKVVFGGLIGGVILFLVKFLFWSTPLSALAWSRVGDPQTSANLQAALAAGLTQTGTGSYLVPNPSTGQGTTLFGQGPIATVHFNAGGFPVVDTSSLIAGLVLALAVGVILALALELVARGLHDVAARARVAVAMAVAAGLWMHIGQPVFNHHGWGWFIYLFLSDTIGLAAAGVVIARWFLPGPASRA